LSVLQVYSLFSFLIVHVGINSTILLNDNGETFNTAAHFMSHFWVIRIMEIGLFVGIIAHIVLTLKLHFENKAKRPVAYAVVDGKANSKWYSRSMALLGTLLLALFLVVHIGQFLVPTKVAVYIVNPSNCNCKRKLEVIVVGTGHVGRCFCRCFIGRIRLQSKSILLSRFSAKSALYCSARWYQLQLKITK
jgi:succinate dehydrogenase/fumarate reductase cytochrome b subunit (b558 family)